MNKTTYGILVLLLNSIGITKWLAGDWKNGLLRAVLSYVTFGILGTINGILGIILGIQILQMSDEEFEAKKDSLDKWIPNFSI